MWRRMLKGVMSDPIDEDSQLGRENQAGKGYVRSIKRCVSGFLQIFSN